MKYSIVPLDNPALRKEARPILPEEIGGEYITNLIKEMKELLSKEALGVAIAAPQVGEAVQLFIVSGKAFDAREENEGEPKDASKRHPDCVYINPVILKHSRKREDKHEGCLTLPGFWGMVERAERVRMQYTDKEGNENVRGASGLLAHIFQHEIDHLHGIIYTDKAHDVYEEEIEINNENS